MIRLSLFAVALFACGLAFGSLVVLLTGRTAPRADWLAPLQPGLIGLARLSVLAALAAAVIFAAALPAYPWAHGEATRGGYLATWAVALRSGLLFGALIAIAHALTRGSLGRGGAAGALVGVILAVSFVAVDWVVSLDAEFRSSEFGLLFVTGWVISAVSLVAAVAAPAWTPRERQRWGGALLGMVVWWSYLEFMQYLIVWSENLPPETKWYLQRIAGGWGWIAATIAVLHVIVPAALLSIPAVRAQLWPLRLAAVSLLAGRVLELLWWMVPASNAGAPSVALGLAVALAVVAGAWVVLGRSYSGEVRHG